MRVRKVEVDWGTGKASLDCRNESGRPLPIVGLHGPNASGKTMLMRAVTRSISASVGRDMAFLDWNKIKLQLSLIWVQLLLPALLMQEMSSKGLLA